jgi:hypothetical protein
MKEFMPMPVSKPESDKKKIEEVFVPRIPKGMVDVLRHKGGPQTSKKGKKGYNRQEGKRVSEN